MLENIRDWIIGVWEAWTGFMRDLFVWLFDAILGAIATAIESLPSPDFLATGADGFLDGVSGDVVYFLGMSGFDNAMALIGVATAFRLVRMFATLGIWS